MRELKLTKNNKHLTLLFIINVLILTTPILGITQSDTVSKKDFSGFLQSGKLGFHSKTFGMGTINEDPEHRFFGLATSLGINYSTPTFYGFKLNIGGYITYRLAEYNLTDADGNWTKTSSEKLLFDINNPTHKYNLASLEEVYLSYTYKNFSVKLGRQYYDTPLLNQNNDRIRPNIFHGISAQYKHIQQKTHLEFTVKGLIPTMVRKQITKDILTLQG